MIASLIPTTASAFNAFVSAEKETLMGGVQIKKVCLDGTEDIQSDDLNVTIEFTNGQACYQGLNLNHDITQSELSDKISKTSLNTIAHLIPIK